MVTTSELREMARNAGRLDAEGRFAEADEIDVAMLRSAQQKQPWYQPFYNVGRAISRAVEPAAPYNMVERFEQQLNQLVSQGVNNWDTRVQSARRALLEAIDMEIRRLQASGRPDSQSRIQRLQQKRNQSQGQMGRPGGGPGGLYR